jgi:hypothetical protein
VIKMKKFIFGFLAAALLFTALPIGAAVQEYILTKSTAKLVVDGAEVTDDTLPILHYNGYNYIPAATFRAICDKIGVGFQWVDDKKEIQLITKSKEADNMDNKTTPKDETTSENTTTPSSTTETTEDTKPPKVTFEGGTWPPAPEKSTESSSSSNATESSDSVDYDTKPPKVSIGDEIYNP